MLKDPAEKEFLQQKKEFLKFLGIPLLSFLYTPLMQKGTERNVQPSSKESYFLCQDGAQNLTYLHAI